MIPYTLAGILVVILVFIAYMYSKSLDYLKKRMTLTSSNPASKRKNTPLQDYVDNIPFALNQTKQIYNDQYDRCIQEKMPKEQAEKVLKPLMDKIKLLESLQKYEPLVRIGAGIGDKAKDVIEKTIEAIE